MVTEADHSRPKAVDHGRYYLQSFKHARMAESKMTESECINKMAPVAEALITIRDKKLYREHYATFEDYVADRWGEECLKTLAVWEEARRERN